MTEISFHPPRNHFEVAAAQQQAQSGEGQQQQQAGSYQPPRCAVHGNETFVPRGTPATDLTVLFGRQP